MKRLFLSVIFSFLAVVVTADVRFYPSENSDPIRLSDGTDAAPSYSFTNSTDMGMFLTAAGLEIHDADFTGAATSVSAIGLDPAVLALSHKDTTGDVWSLDLLDTVFNIKLDDTIRWAMTGTESQTTIPIEFVGVLFASLGTPTDGTVNYCSDCTKATPCAGSGSGAFAKRLNGAWDCD